MSAPQVIDRETRQSKLQEWPVTAAARANPPRPLTPHEIAGLTDAQIEAMDREWLIELVRGSRHPWDDSDMQPHLEFADHCSLLRLAFLARWYCQNAESAAHDLAMMDELDGSLYERGAGTMFGDPR